MFFFINDKYEKIVNLGAVSNIAFLQNEHRVIFNMCYPASITSTGVVRDGPELADYVYWDNYTPEQIDMLKNKEFVKENFIAFPDFPRLVNKNHIASIKVDRRRKRLIINIACGIRLNAKSARSSDFLFIDAKDDEQLEQYKQIAMNLV